MPNSDFGIEKIVSTSFYRIHAVPIKGIISTVDIQTELFPHRTQDEHAKFSKEALSNGGFSYLSVPQIRTLTNLLRLNKNNKGVDEIRKFLREIHRKNWLINSSRIDYMPSGEDVITHNYGLDNQYNIKIAFLGPDEFIINTSNPQGYQALFDTKDNIKEINKDFRFLNGTDLYAWKVNQRPPSKDTRVVWLFAGLYGFGVSCGGDPQCSVPALGGRIFAEGEAPKK